MTERLELGDRAKHCITGFEGIVVGIVDYLQGCRQVCIQPQGLKEDGEPKASIYFDEPYVDLVESQVIPMREAGGMLGEPEEEDDDAGGIVPFRRSGPDKAPGRTHSHTPTKG